MVCVDTLNILILILHKIIRSGMKLQIFRKMHLFCFIYTTMFSNVLGSRLACANYLKLLNLKGGKKGKHILSTIL